MDTKLLVDAIMRQTTVLIAQLSSAAGVRAPLAHIADEVFLSLSQELEAQGVSRKVVADMFGLALRGYQRRVQRLRESATDRGTTLWRAMLDLLHAERRVTRRRIQQRFSHDDPLVVGAVLSDLLGSGLAYRTGNGESAVYGPTEDEDRLAVARAGSLETAAGLVWLEVYQRPTAKPEEIAAHLGMDGAQVEAALVYLEEQGRVRRSGDRLEVDPVIIPVGADAGWETAVFDHFQAVCVALATKLRQGRAQSTSSDTTGGATLRFDLGGAHPLEAEVLGLLERVRAEVNEVWDRVEAYNAAHPLPEAERHRVTFYFGQCLEPSEAEA